MTSDKPRRRLLDEAERCDEIISKVLGKRTDHPIARVIFLLRNPDLTMEQSAVMSAPWYWLPLRRERNYSPDPEKLAPLKLQLWPDGSMPAP